MTISNKICSKCVLPESFPGIHFDERGVCNFCLSQKGAEHQQEKKSEYRDRFDSLVAARRGKSSYDVLMCYSGGKDSTYTLSLFKEKYHLNVLALSFDNGFIPAQTLINIQNVVEKLEVDHIFFKPRFDVLAKVFRYCSNHDLYSPKALERSSAICTSCMGFIKYSALRLAVEKDVPFIGYGWSPGQAPIASSILMNNPAMTKMMQKLMFDPLYEIAGEAIRPYFLEEKHFNGSFNFP